MTDETKKLFDAPWKVDKANYKSDIFGVGLTNLRIFDKNEELITAHIPDEKTAHRLARLPELYEALAVAARVYCPYASLDCRSEEECPHIQIRTGICKRCVALGWLAIMRKVRDGE